MGYRNKHKFVTTLFQFFFVIRNEMSAPPDTYVVQQQPQFVQAPPTYVQTQYATPAPQVYSQPTPVQTLNPQEKQKRKAAHLVISTLAFIAILVCRSLDCAYV